MKYYLTAEFQRVLALCKPDRDSIVPVRCGDKTLLVHQSTLFPEVYPFYSAERTQNGIMIGKLFQDGRFQSRLLTDKQVEALLNENGFPSSITENT